MEQRDMDLVIPAGATITHDDDGCWIVTLEDGTVRRYTLVFENGVINAVETEAKPDGTFAAGVKNVPFIDR
jgi:hypothetical protein